MSKKSIVFKAVHKSKTFWQLDGESVLNAQLEPPRPKAGETANVRITHSNVYGPLTDADFYVRVGDPLEPTDQDDLSAHDD